MPNVGGIFGGTGFEDLGDAFVPLTPAERTALLGGVFEPGSITPKGGKLAGGELTVHGGDDGSESEDAGFGGSKGQPSIGGRSQADFEDAFAEAQEVSASDVFGIGRTIGTVANKLGMGAFFGPLGLGLGFLGKAAEISEATALAKFFGIEPSTGLLALADKEATLGRAAIALTADPALRGFAPSLAAFTFDDDPVNLAMSAFDIATDAFINAPSFGVGEDAGGDPGDAAANAAANAAAGAGEPDPEGDVGTDASGGGSSGGGGGGAGAGSGDAAGADSGSGGDADAGDGSGDF